MLWTLALVAAAVFGWFDVRNRARLDRGLSRHRTDFTVYTAASEALFAGTDPYEAKSPRGWRYVYPPFLAIVVQPLTHLSVPDAALVWYAISIAALGGALLLLLHAIGPPTAVRAVLYASLLCSGFLVQTLQRGQVTILLLALQVAALALLIRRRDVLAGLCLAVGVALRLTPLLPAGMVGLAVLARARREGLAATLRFPAGLLAGLLLTFVVLPVGVLGPARAREVTERWVASSRAVYADGPGHLADLKRDYDVNEWSFKNQGVRRVAGTVTAWLTGTPIDEDGQPSLGARLALVDGLALAVAGLVVLLAIVLALRSMADPTSVSFRRAYAVGLLLPFFVTRYAWPIHAVLALPFLAECLAGGRRGWAPASAAVAGAAIALFYAAHAPALHVLGDAGVLLVGLAAALALALARRDPKPSP